MENIFPELKAVLPNACLRRVFGRPGDFVVEGQVDPPSLRYSVTSPREPVRNEGPFGDSTGYYMLPEPSPVFHVAAQLSGSGLSLMPEGMESVIAVEQMADLIVFLLPPP